jgi:hypothetical protein
VTSAAYPFSINADSLSLAFGIAFAHAVLPAEHLYGSNRFLNTPVYDAQPHRFPRTAIKGSFPFQIQRRSTAITAYKWVDSIMADSHTRANA